MREWAGITLGFTLLAYLGLRYAFTGPVALMLGAMLALYVVAWIILIHEARTAPIMEEEP